MYLPLWVEFGKPYWGGGVVMINTQTLLHMYTYIYTVVCRRLTNSIYSQLINREFWANTNQKNPDISQFYYVLPVLCHNYMYVPLFINWWDL